MLFTEIEKTAKKYCACLSVKENIKEITLNDSWIDIEPDFSPISTPEALQELNWFMHQDGNDMIAAEIAQAMAEIIP